MKEDCLFCKIINKEIESKIIYEDEYVISFLDIHPDTVGHTLVIPKKHILDLNELDDETIIHLNNAVKIVYKKLEDKLKFDGLKVCQNNGVLQEIKHYHIHLLPWYNENPNLSIDEIYELLK